MSLNIRHSVTWDSFKDGCWKLNNAPWPLVSLFLRFRKNPLNYHFGGIYLCFFYISFWRLRWNYKEWIVIFVDFINVLTPTNHSQSFGLDAICVWFAGVYTSIKSTKMKFIPIITYILNLLFHIGSLIW